ncbi:MAG TPA: hypothetical protein VLL72_05595 [Kiloniellales bacterium]|nr:hypothetical protein [Kiloniellales bacterium]
MHKPNHHYRRLRRAPFLVRLAIGLLLVVGGLFGFLPVLGFWMVPIGLLVILIDVPWVQRRWVALRNWWKHYRARA